MRYFALCLFAVFALLSCAKQDMSAGGTVTPSELIRFVIDGQSSKSSSSDGCFDVMYTPIEVSVKGVDPVGPAGLDSFSMNVFRGDGSAVVEGLEFRRISSGYESQQLLWPGEDLGYVFAASNAPFVDSCSVECDGTVDVVGAYADGVYKAPVLLHFSHAYSRLGSVAVNIEGYSASIVKASVLAACEGVYDVRSGWVERGDSSYVDIADDNDLWILPGTHEVRVEYLIGDDVSSAQSAQKEGYVTFLPGMVHDIVLHSDDSFDYLLDVTPVSSVVRIGEGVQLSASLDVAYSGSHLDTRDVTSSAAWTSSSDALATVSAGLVQGVAEGVCSVIASSHGVSDTVSVQVIDHITGYDSPVVSLSYEPGSVGAQGGDCYPVCSYTQSVYWASGKTTVVSDGAQVEYSLPSASGFVLVSSSTGAVRALVNETVDVRRAYPQVTVTLNGKSSVVVAEISQAGAVEVIFD